MNYTSRVNFHAKYSFVAEATFNAKLFKSANAISPKKKIPTNVCTLNFVNKGIKKIYFSVVFQMKDVIDSLPFNLQDHESIPRTTYKLTATTSSKVFKYKKQ